MFAAVVLPVAAGSSADGGPPFGLRAVTWAQTWISETIGDAMLLSSASGPIVPHGLILGSRMGSWPTPAPDCPATFSQTLGAKTRPGWSAICGPEALISNTYYDSASLNVPTS
jgi:hypothetical protein